MVARVRWCWTTGPKVGPEVTITRTVGPMVADLGGGCGCASAGGADLAAALALVLLRGSRRRSPGSR
jgi:MYXO-CTERM domain-containing protein